MESYYRHKLSSSEQQKLCQLSGGFTFQALEWQDGDEEYTSIDPMGDSGSSSEDEKEDAKFGNSNPGGSVKYKYNKKYLIRVFGVTSESQSVCVSIQDYTPFFYIKVPDSFGESQLRHIVRFIESRNFPSKNGNETRYHSFKDCIIPAQCRLEKKKSFYGFQNNKKFTFVRLVFKSILAMKNASYIFNKPVKILSLDVSRQLTFEKYETNVDQIIRYVHTRNIETAGWVSIPKGSAFVDYEKGDCQINLACHWSSLNSLLEKAQAKDKVEILDKGARGAEALANTIAPILQASFDIECFSHDYSFPQPSVPENVVTAIATAFKRYGEPDFFLKHVITLKKSNPLQNITGNVILECYDTEVEVLLAWTRLIKGMDPDIIYSYNGDQFDCNYLIVRSKMPNVNCYNEFSQLSRIRGVRCDIKEQTFSSGAYGDTNFKRLSIPGRINFDILIQIKRDLKLESYKLDNVAEKYLGEKKHEVSVAQIFDNFASGDPEKIRVITEYCIQDTLLPQRLVDRLDILPIQIEMARITYVPLRYLIEKGQQVKVFSQILKRTRKAGFLIPHLQVFGNSEKFKGAYVLDPVVGAHWKPVTTLDFASLYPTIMISHNMCYSSIVIDQKYNNLPGVEYYHADWKETNSDNQSISYDYSFVQNTEAILPILLSDLYKSRKMVKKLMAKESEPFKKAILNGRQLAIKVSMNSIYGFLAAQTLQCKAISASVTAVGRKMIDDTRTFAETKFVDFINSKGLCEGRKLTGKVIYGDSVSGNTPLLLLNPDTNQIELKTIETLSDTWVPYNEFKIGPEHNNETTNRREKLQATSRYKVWSPDGWTNIRRVIKHLVNKKMFRVQTNKGCIDVTEDHSLLLENGDKIKPGECKIGTKLFHSFPDITEFQYPQTIDITFEKYVKPVEEETGVILTCKACKVEKDETMFSKKKASKLGRFPSCKKCNSDKYYATSIGKCDKYTYEPYELTKEEAFVWGLFFADGNAGMYTTKVGSIKNSWSITNNKIELLNKAKGYLETCFPNNNEFFIVKRKNVSCNRLQIKGDIHHYANKYRGLFYDKDKHKIVPTEILNASREIKQWFYNGYSSGDSCKGKEKLTTRGKIGAQGLYIILKSIGKDRRVNARTSNLRHYDLYASLTGKYRTTPNEIKKIIELPPLFESQFVYDLETDCGKFHAGVGELNIFNTDSIFVSFDSGLEGVEAIRESFKLGKLCADLATKELFKYPIVLEFEKVYGTLLLFGKKYYVGTLYENSPDEYDYVDTKGIVLKRRDNCNLLKTIYQGALDIILEKKQSGVDEAIAFIKKWIDDLIAGNIDMSQLILSKSIRGGYAEDCHSPHVVLSRKLALRDAGSAPSPGDRVPYVFINTGNYEHKQYEKVEDPVYAKEHNLTIDTLYYVEHQLKNPLVQLLSVLQDDPEAFFKNIIEEIKFSQKDDRRKSKNALKGQNEITNFFLKTIKK